MVCYCVLTGGADPDSLEYAGSAIQRTMLDIGRAADDLVIIFGIESRDVAALYSVWAAKEARQVAALLKKNALAAAATASTGLATTMQVT